MEFGPWVRRFLAQVRRNWFIPYAAMSLRGHVSVSFNVHKNGSITDIAVVGSTGIEAFNNSSFNAIAASNPTLPLPPEYPCGPGVHHHHLLLQRDAALTLMASPTRTQQLGWLLLLGALAVWALVKLAGWA